VGPLAGVLALAGVTVFGLPPLMAVLAALASLAHDQTVELWTVPLSEPLFLFFIVAGVVAWRAERPGWALGLLTLATWVRTLAAPFLAVAWVLEWRRARRVTPGMAVSAAALAPWALWLLLHPGAVPPELVGLFGSYGGWYLWSFRTDPATMLTQVPWQNLQVLLAELGRRFTSNLVPWLVAFLLGGGAVWLLWRARRERLLVASGLAVYGGMVLLWPFPADRFLAAVWPLLLLALLAAVPGKARWLACGLAVAVALFQAARGDALRFHRARTRYAAGVADAARRVVPSGVTIASTNPQLHYLLLGTPAVPGQRMRSTRAYRNRFWSTAWGSGDDVWAIIQRYAPAYLIIERRGVEGRFAAGSLLGQCPGALETAWESPAWQYIMRVHPDVPCSPRPSVR
jgi:hypothetical protein